MKYSKKYILDLVETVMNQICAEVGASVVMSWGVRSVGGGETRNADGYTSPCVVLGVSGLVHTGLVVVALNEGTDTYEVQLRTPEGVPVGETHTDVYCDQLGHLIDSLVERPSDMSDEAYEFLSTLDTIFKEMTENEQ